MERQIKIDAGKIATLKGEEKQDRQALQVLLTTREGQEDPRLARTVRIRSFE